MPQVVTAGPENGWYGSSIFGSAGFGGAGNGGSFPNQMGGFANQFGGGFNTPIQSAWGNETFVPPTWGTGGVSQPNPGFSSPQSYIPSSSGYGTLTLGGGGGSALSGGYGAPTSSGSIGGGSFGAGGGTPLYANGSGNGPASAYASAVGGGEFGQLSESPQGFSALAGDLGSGGSITPQYAQLADAMGFSPAEAESFAGQYGQQQQQQQVNPADLPSQNASEMQGNLFNALGNTFSQAFNSQNGIYPVNGMGGTAWGGTVNNANALAQVIEGEAGNSSGLPGPGPAGEFAVAATIANRLANGGYGSNISQVVTPSQFNGASFNGTPSPTALSFANAILNNNLSQYGTLGNALYYNAAKSPYYGNGATQFTTTGTNIGGNLFSNVQGNPTSSFVPPGLIGWPTIPQSYGSYQSPFSGQLYSANPYAPYGLPMPADSANGYGYPAGGASTMSDSLLAQMGFNTGTDYTNQLLSQWGAGYGDAGYGGGYDTSSSYAGGNSGIPVYTYGNDISNNPSNYSDIGGYSPSYGADFGTGGVTDLGTDTSGQYDFSDSGGYSGSF